jgi:23S rRNA pseudouridine1911/1915/1917 synthase
MLTVLRTFEATTADRGKRLDQFLHERLPEHSRSRLQEWVRSGRVRVDSNVQKPSFALRGGEKIELEPTELPPLRAVAEDIPLDILYVDADVIAVNKPAGIAVHAGAGRHSGTLVNALLHHFQSLSTVGGDERPGIVHRLDRDTSGVMIVARTDPAHRHLAAQFSNREVTKIYLALVEGELRQAEGQITSPIMRDPVRRTRMTTRLEHGRSARTEYKVLERLPKKTFVEVRIGTGRTHQIRVHMASIRHPVAGDTLYGAAAASYGRFFLHAKSIEFRSPSTGEPRMIEAPVPEELQRWLGDVRGDKLRDTNIDIDVSRSR